MYLYGGRLGLRAVLVSVLLALLFHHPVPLRDILLLLAVFFLLFFVFAPPPFLLSSPVAEDSSPV
jgi:hypothetical protein